MTPVESGPRLGPGPYTGGVEPLLGAEAAKALCPCNIPGLVRRAEIELPIHRFLSLAMQMANQELVVSYKLFFDSADNSTVCYDVIAQHSGRDKDQITVSGIFRASEGAYGTRNGPRCRVS